MTIFKNSLRAFGAALFLGTALTAPTTAVANSDADYQVPLSAEAMALADELDELGFATTEVGAFYSERGYQPLWFSDRDLMRGILVAMYRSHDHGLPSESYGAVALADLIIRADTPKGRAHAEIAMSDAFLRYARHLNSGVLKPSSVDKEIHTIADVKDANLLLGMIGSAQDADAVVAALAPANSDYARLMAEKATLEAEIASGGYGEAIPANRLIRPGDNGRHIELVRARMDALGYEVELAGTEYDEALLVAVKQFQGDHLLSQDGVLGPATIGRLNLSPSGRLEQILVNLERMRWLNIERGERHIRVNIPDYSMAVIDLSLIHI